MSETRTDASERYAELRRLAEAATPGPWAAEIIPWDAAERKLSPIQWTGLYIGREDDERPGKVFGTFIEGNVVDEPAAANVAYIVAACNALPALLDSNKRMREALETIKGGRTDRFPGAPDVMNSSPEDFRSAMWTWSQQVARAALAPETEGGPE